jgi:drug/metabolite transporter (DMT)-like permease
LKLRAWLAFLLLGLVWGSSFFWIKIAVQEIGPFTLVAYRLLFGALGLLGFVVFRRPDAPAGRQEWLAMGLLGLTNTAIPFVLISWGEQFIDSGVASILNSTVPLFTMLIAHLFLLDERITRGKVLGLLVGFGGVVLLFSQDVAGGLAVNSLLGQAAVLVAALMYAGSSVFARRFLRQVSPILQAFITVTVADVLVWIAAPLVESPLEVPAGTLIWISIIWLGILGSCVAYLLYFYLIQEVGSTRATLVTYVLPVVGVALGVIFLNEQLNVQLAAGTILVVAGVWVVNRG